MAAAEDAAASYLLDLRGTELAQRRVQRRAQPLVGFAVHQLDQLLDGRWQVDVKGKKVLGSQCKRGKEKK